MKYLDKKQTSILLAAVAIVGSIITFYGSNLLFSDLSNMFYSAISKDIITSLPIFFVSIQMVAAFICLLDLYADSGDKRRNVIKCSNVLMVTGLFGAAASIVSYTVIYSRFMSPYPFKFAGIILLAYYAIIFVGTGFLKARGKKLQKTEKEKRTFANILFRISRAIFVFYSFNRFGALLLSPTYMRIRTFVLTLPFYLSLLIPITFISLMVYCQMDFGGRNSKSGVLFASILFIADLLLSAAVFVLGSMFTEFTAAVSPALPLERLISVPVDVIIQCVVSTALGIYALIATSKRYKNDTRRN